MKFYLKLAWRNLWRNKRRTLITIAAIFFSVILSAVMSSMQEGSYEMMVDSVVKYFSGAIQIHQKGFWDDQSINNGYFPGDTIDEKVNTKSSKDIIAISPRLENFALASSNQLTRGAMILGIVPSREDKITSISKKIISGKYLNDNDSSVIVGDGLAKFLKLKVNDTLVLLGQGYHGASAVGKYHICGILKHPSPEISKLLVYMNLKTSGEFNKAPGLVTSYVILTAKYKKVHKTRDQIKKLIGSNYEVMSWDEMQRLILQQIESDRQSGKVMKAILYMVIGFGILGTIIMMMVERKREFGVVLSLGMHKYQLKRIVLIETVLIGLIGVLTGIVASIPIIWYYYLHPIPLVGQVSEVMIDYGFEPVIKFAIIPGIFINQAITIFILCMCIAMYPVYHISKLKVIQALRA